MRAPVRRSRRRALFLLLVFVLTVLGARLFEHPGSTVPRSAPARPSQQPRPPALPAPPRERCASTASPLTSLQAFVDAAEAAQRHGETACLRPRTTLTVEAPATVSSPAVLDFNGATLTKAATMNGFALVVLGAHVSILDVNLDGNERHGAAGGGILWLGGDGLAYGDHVSGTAGNGFEISGETASLVAEDCSSDGNADDQLAGDGFFVSSGALFRAYGVSAAHNDHSGFFLTRAAAGSTISGVSVGNRFAGLQVEATDGFLLPRFSSVDDWHYGVYLGGDSDGCSIGQLRVLNTGIAEAGLPTNPYGAGIELFGAANCRADSIVDSVTYTATSGYGVAIARQPPGSSYSVRGSDHNVFESIQVSGTANPAIDITGSSSDNTIVNAVATDSAVGVNIGEGTVGNDGNVFDHLLLEDDWLAGLGIESSDGNVFRHLQLLDVGSRYKSVDGNAAIRLIGSAAGNLLAEVTVQLDPLPPNEQASYHVPQYIVYAAPGTRENRLGLVALAGKSYLLGPWIDHGTNMLVRGPVRA